MTELNFALDVEDGWPPVAIECIPYTGTGGGYRIDAAPLFVKNISVGDVISVEEVSPENVTAWTHVSRSKRTTIWLLRMGEPHDIPNILEELRSLDCNTLQLAQLGCYSVDVPAECPIAKVDACLARLDKSRVAIAYPSFRHLEQGIEP